MENHHEPHVTSRLVPATIASAHALWLLVTRRASVPPGASPLSYAQETAVMMWLLTGLCVVEVIAVDLLVPWHRLPEDWWWLRWVALVLGVLGVVTTAAFVAVQTTRPHYVVDGHLTLRSGATFQWAIPLDRIKAAHTQRRSHDSTKNVRYESDSAGLVLSVTQLGSTNVELHVLPQLPASHDAHQKSVHTVHFFADSPEDFLRLWRAHHTSSPDDVAGP